METIANFIASIPDSPGGLLRFITHLLLAHGYLVVLIGAALDNFGLPASGDVVLFAGGWMSNLGRAELPWIILYGFTGALISDNSVYWIGRAGGRPLVDRILKMRFLHFLVNEKSLIKVESYFEGHGGKTVFVGRFGPGLRSMTPLFAGVTRMKYYKFIFFNLCAVTLWAVGYTLVGYVFGEYWDDLLAVAKSVGYSVVGLFGLIVAFYIYRRRRQRRKQKE